MKEVLARYRQANKSSLSLAGQLQPTPSGGTGQDTHPSPLTIQVLWNFPASSGGQFEPSLLVWSVARRMQSFRRGRSRGPRLHPFRLSIPARPPDRGYLRPGPGVPGSLFGHRHAEEGHFSLTFSLCPVLTASCHLEAHSQDRRRESLSRGLSFRSYI